MGSNPEAMLALLDAYVPAGDVETADLARLRSVARAGSDLCSRTEPLHVTGSALVVHPPTRRILLRWHERMQRWLQVGGHFDPGEPDPLAVARREAEEETGLHDLVVAPATGGWPVQVVVVPVAPGGGEPEHEHADVRYVLVTDEPEGATPESDGAPLRWLTIDDALAEVHEDNLRVLIARAAHLLGWRDA